MNLKREAARHALSYVESGMVLALGTGSTTAHFLDLLGQRLRSGQLIDIVGVPTSRGTTERARAAGIPLSTLEQHSRLDLAVDGADEVDPQLNLIKGLGRALLREKIVEMHCDQFVVIVDESKLVPRLGATVPLPLEVLPFGLQAHLRWLNRLGCHAVHWLEEDGSPVVTDNGNYMALCEFPEGISDPHRLARRLADRPGIIEHGLFLGMATAVVAAGESGICTLAPGDAVEAN
jgi:ribose 5-phosphate isomerase A